MHAIQRNAGSSAEQVFTLEREKLEWLSPGGISASHKAIPTMEKLVSRSERSPGDVELLATAYARAGNRTEALRLIDQLKQRRQKGYIPAGALINPYFGLGEYDQAFFWFEEAYKEQSNILQFIKVHPFFDAVRGDPRFRAELTILRLPILTPPDYVCIGNPETIHLVV